MSSKLVENVSITIGVVFLAILLTLTAIALLPPQSWLVSGGIYLFFHMFSMLCVNVGIHSNA
jgi:hypothetical protein